MATDYQPRWIPASELQNFWLVWHQSKHRADSSSRHDRLQWTAKTFQRHYAPYLNLVVIYKDADGLTSP